MSNKVRVIFIFLSVSLAAGGFWLWNGKGNLVDSSPVSLATVRVKAKEAEVKNKEPEVVPEKITLLFGGDLMLDRYLRQVALKKGYDFLFEKIDPLLSENDLNVVNLEGPITDNPSVSLMSAFGARENYIFTFDPASAGALKRHRIGLTSLGNNHILNFNDDGLEQTESYLEKAGVNYFGSPNSDSRFWILDSDGFKVAFVSYNQFIYQGKEKALEDIAQVKGVSDLVILYAHWGKEYETEPLQQVKDLAYEFVDSGADLIIGSHPHVVQGKEVYRNKTIYYSLGNFIFDQYFQPETQAGLAVKVVINPADKSITFREIPLKLQNNGQTIFK